MRDDEVLHQSARGKLKESHLDAIFAAYRAALTSMARPRGLWYAIADWAGVGAVQWQARVHYIERLKALHDEFPCRFAAVFGLNRTMRMMINVSRRFSPIGVYQVEGPEDADALIQKDRAKGPLPLRSQSRDPARRGAVAQAHVEEGIQEFLGVLGSIHWDRDGEVEERGAYSETHLFRPLYEAVAIIKDDIDDVFREKLQAEQILERQNRVNGLRAEIWRKAMEQDLGEDSLLLALLSHIGPALGASRAAFHRFLREDDPASPLRCACPSPAPSRVEPGNGRVVSCLIPEWLSRPVFQVLTPEAVRGRAGDWPIVEHWAGLALVALQPFRVRERFVGWFTSSRCAPRTSPGPTSSTRRPGSSPNSGTWPRSTCRGAWRRNRSARPTARWGRAPQQKDEFHQSPRPRPQESPHAPGGAPAEDPRTDPRAGAEAHA